MEGILHQLNFVLRRGSWESFFSIICNLKFLQLQTFPCFWQLRHIIKSSSFSYIGFISGKKIHGFQKCKQYIGHWRQVTGFCPVFFGKDFPPAANFQRFNLGPVCRWSRASTALNAVEIPGHRADGCYKWAKMGPPRNGHKINWATGVSDP